MRGGGSKNCHGVERIDLAKYLSPGRCNRKIALALCVSLQHLVNGFPEEERNFCPTPPQHPKKDLKNDKSKHRVRLIEQVPQKEHDCAPYSCRFLRSETFSFCGVDAEIVDSATISDEGASPTRRKEAILACCERLDWCYLVDALGDLLHIDRHYVLGSHAI
jgi:hypothetical protein